MTPNQWRPNLYPCVADTTNRSGGYANGSKVQNKIQVLLT